MAASPLSGLPVLVQREITSYLNVMDIFMLTLVSPEFYNIARKIRKIENLHWSFNHKTYSTIILNEEDDSARWQILFMPPNNMESRRESLLKGKEYSTVFSPATIKGIPIFVSKIQSYSETSKYIMVDYSMERQERQLTLIKMFTEHCIGLFGIQKFTVKFNALVPPIVDCFIFDYTKKLENIEVTRSAVMETEEIQFMFGEIELSTAKLITNLPRDHAYLGPLKVDEIRMEHTDWLAMEAILNSETKSIYSSEDTLTDADWNTIIKKWMDGGLQKLQNFTMDLPNASVLHHDEAQILDGIPHIPFNERNRPQYYYKRLHEFVGFDWTEGYDFQRTDGTWASLAIQEYRDIVFRIQMFVWLEEYTLTEVYEW